jgi:hypothetical protein
MGRYENHRVMRRAPAERTGAWIEYAVPVRHKILHISMLTGCISIVSNNKFPCEGIMLGRECVKRRHTVFVRLIRPASFQDEDAVAGLRQIRSDRAAARAGAHDDVVVFVVHAVREHGVAMPNRIAKS